MNERININDLNENRIKQAIDNLTRFHIDKMEVFTVNLDGDLDIALQLIEKQQAEIETLKRDFEIVDHECSRLEQEDIKKDKMINLMAKDIKEADKFLDSMSHLGEYAGYTIEDIIEEYKKEAEYKIKEDK